MQLLRKFHEEKIRKFVIFRYDSLKQCAEYILLQKVIEKSKYYGMSFLTRKWRFFQVLSKFTPTFFVVSWVTKIIEKQQI